MIKKILLFIFLIFFSQIVFSQTGNVRGFVYDKATGEPVLFTPVFLKGTSYGVQTDVNGYYSITRIPPGDYQLMALGIGYDTMQVDISIKADQIVSKQLYLKKVAVNLKTVEVSGENDYYDARNSYLHTVLETRRGIPITLALVYLEIAAQIGLVANGISFPGHFLVKLRMPRGDVVIDPFTGQSMSRDALDALLVPYRRGQALALGQSREAADRVPLGLFLQPALARDILARMLRNLKEVHRNGEDWSRLKKVLDRLVVLLPEAWEERRDRGLVAARLGAVESATADLALYLERAPHAPDRIEIAERLVDLGHGDASRLL